jgi:chaperone required for assembly of F1-ATPase
VSTLARRFYETATAKPDHGVALDRRTLRTPGGAAFVAPTAALAEAVAAEWAAQGDHITPSTMPLTQLAFAAIDHTPKRREELIDYVVKFAETDLVCHRADAPADLAALQAERWDRMRDWFAAFVGADLPVVIGVLAADVPEGERAKARAAAAALDDFRLTALAQAAGLAGSAVLGFAVAHGRITPEAAFEAAAVDDLWSQEKWGADAEAQARLDRQRAEFAHLAQFVAALG